jgi:hypothetical protein
MTNNKNIPSDYNEIINKTVEGKKVKYGIIHGNEKIVFIKKGADGNPKTFKSKYLKMAYRVHDRLGATVICATNPETENNQVSQDYDTISFVISKNNFTNYEVYLFGASDGAYHNLILGTKIPQTVKFVGVSTSRIGIEDFKNKISDLSDVKKILVYGTKDYERDIIPSLNDLWCDNLKLITVPEANHEFTGMTDEFIELIDLL